MSKKQIDIDQYTREKGGKTETVSSHSKVIDIKLKPEMSKEQIRKVISGQSKNLIDEVQIPIQEDIVDDWKLQINYLYNPENDMYYIRTIDGDGDEVLYEIPQSKNKELLIYLNKINNQQLKEETLLEIDESRDDDGCITFNLYANYNPEYEDQFYLEAYSNKPQYETLEIETANAKKMSDFMEIMGELFPEVKHSGLDDYEIEYSDEELEVMERDYISYMKQHRDEEREEKKYEKKLQQLENWSSIFEEKLDELYDKGMGDSKQFHDLNKKLEEVNEELFYILGPDDPNYNNNN